MQLAANGYAGPRRAEAASALRDLSDSIPGAETSFEALERWCEAHHLASAPITFEKSGQGDGRYPYRIALYALALRPEECLQTRRTLVCHGDRLLCEAADWYVPSRLPPYIRIALQAASIPFGVAVRRLSRSRRTMSVQIVDSPSAPAAVLEHDAVLLDSKSVPLGLVCERYYAPPLSRGVSVPTNALLV